MHGASVLLLTVQLDTIIDAHSSTIQLREGLIDVARRQGYFESDVKRDTVAFVK